MAISGEALLHLRSNPEQWSEHESELPFWFCLFLVLKTQDPLPARWAGLRKIVRRHRPRSQPRQELPVALQQVHRPHSCEAHVVWLLLVLEHRNRAVDGLLRGLRDPDDFVAQGCLWALSRLGRESFCDLKELYGKGSPKLKERVAQLLFLLGDQARGCEEWLEPPGDPWTHAALLGLGVRGSLKLVQYRQCPTILSPSARSELTELFFGHDLEDRIFALQTLRQLEPSSALSQRLHRLAFLEFDSALTRNCDQACWDTVRSELGNAELCQLLLQPGFTRQKLSLLELIRRSPDFQDAPLPVLEALSQETQVLRLTLLRMLDLFSHVEIRRKILEQLLGFESAYPAGLAKVAGLLEHPELQELAARVCVQMCDQDFEQALELCPKLVQVWVRQKYLRPLVACLTDVRVLQALQGVPWVAQLLERASDQNALAPLLELRDPERVALVKELVLALPLSGYAGMDALQQAQATFLLEADPERFRQFQLAFWQDAEIDPTLLNRLSSRLHLPSDRSLFRLGLQHLTWLQGLGREGFEFLVVYLEEQKEALAAKALAALLERVPESLHWLLDRPARWFEQFLGSPIEVTLAEILQQALVGADQTLEPELKVPWVLQILKSQADSTLSIYYLQCHLSEFTPELILALRNLLGRPQASVRLQALHTLARRQLAGEDELREWIEKLFWQESPLEPELLLQAAARLRLPPESPLYHVGPKEAAWLEGLGKLGFDFFLRYLETQKANQAVDLLGSWLFREAAARRWLIERTASWLKTFAGSSIEASLAQTLQWILVSVDQEIEPQEKIPWLIAILDKPINTALSVLYLQRQAGPFTPQIVEPIRKSLQHAESSVRLQSLNALHRHQQLREDDVTPLLDDPSWIVRGLAHKLKMSFEPPP